MYQLSHCSTENAVEFSTNEYLFTFEVAGFQDQSFYFLMNAGNTTKTTHHRHTHKVKNDINMSHSDHLK